MMVDKKEGNPMEEMVTSFVKLPVYTRNGIYVGNVKNVIMDVEKKRISSLLLTKTNPTIIEGAMDVAVPYRWVNAVGDIVILSYFPEKVLLREEKEETSAEVEEGAEIETIDEPLA
jgi:sporulation protein YlmC with PRC-barrel domain